MGVVERIGELAGNPDGLVDLRLVWGMTREFIRTQFFIYIFFFFFFFFF